MKTKTKLIAKATLSKSAMITATLLSLCMPITLLANEDVMQLNMQNMERNGSTINILGNWRVSLIEIDGAFTRVPAQAEDVSIQINTNQISGIAGCNNFMSPYTLSTNKQQITINEGVSTKKMCHPQEVMRFEDSFLRLLNGTFMIEKNFQGIVLVRDNVKIYLVK